METNWNAIKESIFDDINNVIVAHKGFVTEGSERENSSEKSIEFTVSGSAVFFKDSFCPNTVDGFFMRLSIGINIWLHILAT